MDVMETLFLALIQQLNSSVIVLIVILVLALWGMFRLGGVTTYFKEVKDKNDRFDNQINLIKDALSAIKATTELLYQVHLKTVQSASPVSLTAIGKEISGTLNIPRKVADHWEQIQTEMGRSNPVNPYDIQGVAMNIARNCFDSIFSDSERNEIKTLAFNRGMNLLEIYPVIGIEIRNRIFQERGISLEEIDKHDPARSVI